MEYGIIILLVVCIVLLLRKGTIVITIQHNHSSEPAPTTAVPKKLSKDEEAALDEFIALQKEGAEILRQVNTTMAGGDIDGKTK